jgi:hypothetical protein
VGVYLVDIGENDSNVGEYLRPICEYPGDVRFSAGYVDARFTESVSEGGGVGDRESLTVPFFSRVGNGITCGGGVTGSSGL